MRSRYILPFVLATTSLLATGGDEPRHKRPRLSEGPHSPVPAPGTPPMLPAQAVPVPTPEFQSEEYRKLMQELLADLDLAEFGGLGDLEPEHPDADPAGLALPPISSLATLPSLDDLEPQSPDAAPDPAGTPEPATILGILSSSLPPSPTLPPLGSQPTLPSLDSIPPAAAAQPETHGPSARGSRKRERSRSPRRFMP